MNSQTPFYKVYLRRELDRRCESNANYSMRSFARALRVDPAVLSRTLSDKRALSYKVAKRVINHLHLSPQECSIFLESVAEDHKQRGLKKNEAFSDRRRPEVGEIDAELFVQISDWYHHAIHRMTALDQFRSDPEWIADRLGISVLETRQALQRLSRAGMIKEENGQFRPGVDRIETHNQAVSTPALRKHQKQMFQKAIAALDGDGNRLRSVTGLTMPIDPAKIPLAKQLIADFSQHICEVLGSGKKQSVHQLSIALFPLEVGDSGPTHNS